MPDESEGTNQPQLVTERVEMNIPKTGEQTVITPKVKEIADAIYGQGIIAAMNIADYIKSMDTVEGSEGPDFRRTADEILKDNKYNGCNEAGVVFAALLRAKGIPTIYIQALKEEAVKNYSQENPSLNGHVFLEVSFEDDKDKEKSQNKIINSTTGEITDTLPEDMIEGAKGLDAWDVGLREGFKDLQKLFEEKHNL